MLEQLFGSKTRVKLLRLFFREEFRAFFVRELTRLLDTQINAVRRELDTLVEIGLVEEVDMPAPKDQVDDGAGSQLRKYYRLNRECVIHPEMQALMAKSRLLEEQAFVEGLRAKGGEMKLLLLSGRFTGDATAPTDLLVVGTLKERVIQDTIASYEKELGFDVRYTLMSEKEFADRRHVMDRFLYTLFEAKHIKVVNTIVR